MHEPGDAGTGMLTLLVAATVGVVFLGVLWMVSFLPDRIARWVLWIVLPSMALGFAYLIGGRVGIVLLVAGVAYLATSSLAESLDERSQGTGCWTYGVGVPVIVLVVIYLLFGISGLRFALLLAAVIVAFYAVAVPYSMWASRRDCEPTVVEQVASIEEEEDIDGVLPPLALGLAPPARSALDAGWYADPMGRHQHRYWDGNAWTTDVANGILRSRDAGIAK
jgi:hypothetical protein